MLQRSILQRSIEIAGLALALSVGAAAAQEPLKIGLVQAMTGAFNTVGKAAVNGARLYIQQHGDTVAGRKIQLIVRDDAASPEAAKRLAQGLIVNDKVAALFGCWTSVSRKCVLPVVEENNALLFYPVPYEGMECSKNVIYTGSVQNQQFEPAAQGAGAHLTTKFFVMNQGKLVFEGTETELQASQDAYVRRFLRPGGA